MEKTSNPNRTRIISGLSFGMLSSAEMLKMSSLHVCSRELYSRLPARAPAPFGVLDSRLGVSDKGAFCGTCGKGQRDCAGHWGHIELELPVFHIGFLRATTTVLQNVCKSCSRVLLTEDERKSYLKRLRDPSTDALKRGLIRRKITEATKKVTCCPWCGALNGPVKKVNGTTCFRLIHDKYRWEKVKSGMADGKESFLRLFDSVVGEESSIQPLSNRAVEELSPLKSRQILRAILDSDLDLLWQDRHRGRPENMILSHVMVPPIAIRPSVSMEAGAMTGSNEDDITIKLQEIVHINTALRIALEKGASSKMVQEDWDFLQVQVATLINGELPGMPPSLKPRRPIRALAQRLKGKQGRFRGNLSGKRVDFSGRTVISPDPNMPIHCVGVPLNVASIMTYPEAVTAFNLDRLRAAVSNGPIYPGAYSVRQAEGQVKSLSFGDRRKVAAMLKPGDVVERHLIDGDAVLFNRQPSLHKLSIMCHRVRVLPGRTFRFNECVCTPYNADFDGDEMNLHLPQTEEARTEAALLLDVRENLITSRSGEPLIAAHQDFITASWLITQKDVLIDRDAMCQVASYVSDACEHVDLPPPAILKPGPFWTGKQVIDVLLRPNKKIQINASFEAKARNYSEKGFAMCENDGYCVVRDGQLLSGNLDKNVIGSGSKTGLVYTLIRDNSGPLASRALLRLTKMTSRWISEWGFSIGIEDVSPARVLRERKESVLQSGYATARGLIQQFRDGVLPLQPGCDEEQSLEALMNGTLSKLRQSMGRMCMDELPRLNPARVMATCGSKGSELNISQMISCVGQQSVGGARIQEGFVERTLPGFLAGAKDPAAKGFVANSFFSGLLATEFFFHTMGGREGLVDTAVKTADTGYMQRRMMKTLEDLCVQYDGSVRTSSGDVVQFSYGDDGLDPAYMETKGKPVDFGRAFLQAQVQSSSSSSLVLPSSKSSLVKNSSGAMGLFPSSIRSVVDSALHSTSFLTKLGRRNVSSRSAVPASVMLGEVDPSVAAESAFVASIKDFFDTEVAAKMELKLKDVGISDESSVKGSVGHQYLTLSPTVLSSASSNDRAFEKKDEAAAIVLYGQAGGHTRSQLIATLDTIASKYRRAMIQPGEAVGAVAAHSLGEPATQMTLKTFHFAGVASMNVTLGVPRIKEIMNASREISTPIIEAPLENADSEVAARVVKARIEKTTLGDIAISISEVYAPEGAHLEVKLDLGTIEALHLEGIDAYSIKSALEQAPKLHLKDGHVRVTDPDTILVIPPPQKSASRLRAERSKMRELLKEKDQEISAAGQPQVRSSKKSAFHVEDSGDATQREMDTVDGTETDMDFGINRDRSTVVIEKSLTGQELMERSDLYFVIQGLKASLPKVIVQGIPEVSRAVITRTEASSKSNSSSTTQPLKLLVEGNNLLRVMGVPGVKGTETISNHVMEVENCLGIEAARVMIQQELARTYKSYGIVVDSRHLQLLSDIMTYKGAVLGITRFGIAKMKESVLMLASFEKTPDHLFDAAVHARIDPCVGVSESIILGTPIPLGTGLFSLVGNL